MSRSKRQHDKGWNAPNRILKHHTKTRRRAAEREFLENIKKDIDYCENNYCPIAREIENIWNWD